MRDTSFTSADDGYALDVRGGLFRTVNGGASWQPIDPGTTRAPQAVITSGDTVLLAGPRGIRRATAGGEFSSSDKPRARAWTSSTAPASAIFAYGADGDRAHHQRRPRVDGGQGPVAQAREAVRCACATSR